VPGILDAWPGAARLVDGCARGRPPSSFARNRHAGPYDEPHRRYHDRRHLAEVLAALRTLLRTSAAWSRLRCLAARRRARGRDDDEERSADLAVQVLTDLAVSGRVVDEVARLVRMTSTHDPAPRDDPGELLSDADLAVLGAPPERYARYAADVRSEYAHVPDAAFRTGRSAVLRDLLDRPRLFRTSAGTAGGTRRLAATCGARSPDSASLRTAQTGGLEPGEQLAGGTASAPSASAGSRSDAGMS
jgi:predicted metal-dependent HD superfamily phosphohydrolase